MLEGFFLNVFGGPPPKVGKHWSSANCWFNLVPVLACDFLIEFSARFRSLLPAAAESPPRLGKFSTSTLYSVEISSFVSSTIWLFSRSLASRS